MRHDLSPGIGNGASFIVQVRALMFVTGLVTEIMAAMRDVEGALTRAATHQLALWPLPGQGRRQGAQRDSSATEIRDTVHSPPCLHASSSTGHRCPSDSTVSTNYRSRLMEGAIFLKVAFRGLSQRTRGGLQSKSGLQAGTSGSLRQHHGLMY